MPKFTLLLVLLFFASVSKSQLAIVASDTDACPAQSITLTASGADEYSWMPVSGMDTTGGDIVQFSGAAGNYTFTVYGVDTSASDTDTVSLSITVHSNPIASIVSSAFHANNFVCLGNSATLTATSIPSGQAFAWEFDSSLSATDTNVVTVNPTVNTTYSVTVTDIYGCVDDASVSLSVNPTPPNINMVVTESTICPGNETSLTANGGGFSFQWSPSASLNVDDERTVIAKPTTTTTYTVTATANGCTNTASVTINVLAAPSLSFTQSSGGAAICLDGTEVITLTCPTCVLYRWKFANSTLETTNTTQVISPDEVGISVVRVTGIDTNACFDFDDISVQVDSCFNGDPFGLIERQEANLKIMRNERGLFVSSNLNIDYVEVFNLLGDAVAKANDIGKTTWSLGGQALPAGVYVVKAGSGTENRIEKIYVH